MGSNTAQIKALLTGANQLSTQDLDTFFQQVKDLLSRRNIPSLPQDEANLLLQIQESVPLSLLERAASLHKKRRDEIISESEQGELAEITHQIEMHHLKRMNFLVVLAKKRKVSLKTLMDQLGIVPFNTHG
jgi:hypothetical protein